MTRPRWFWPVLAATCALQLAIPASMIVRHERTLRSGESFRFEVAPVDPVDALRGRYVALGFPSSITTVALGSPDLAPGGRGYAPIEVGLDGLARFGRLSGDAPATGPYLEVRVEAVDAATGEAGIALPFDRFYTDEDEAQAADRVYAERAGSGRSWALVRILDGHAVLTDVVVDGRPLRELAREIGAGAGVD